MDDFYGNNDLDNKVTKNKKAEDNSNLVLRIFHGFVGFCFYAFIIALVGIGGYKIYNYFGDFYLEKNEVSMIINDTYSINILGKVTEKKNENYTYSSSNENIVKVDKQGNIKTVSEGEATITVKSKYSNNTEKLVVTVIGSEIYSIEFENEILNMEQTTEAVLVPIINGEKNFIADVEYSVDNENVARVTSGGRVIAKQPGITYITVKVKNTNISSKAKVTVTEKITNTKTETEVSTTEPGSNETGTQENSGTTTSKPTQGSTNKGSTTTSKPSQGSTYKGSTTTKKGTTTKKPTNKSNTTKKTTESNEENESGYEEETVNRYVSVTSVSSKLEKNIIKVGETTKLIYTINPETSTNKSVTFSSSNTKVATVDSKGNIKAVGEGKADIIVKTKDGNHTSYQTLTVEKEVVYASSISLDKNGATIYVGDTITFTHTISPSNTTNKNVTWSSSNNNIAIVNTGGTVTGISAGTVTITVKTSNGKTTTAKVTVKNKTIDVTSINLNKTETTILEEGTEQLSAIISPDNATNKHITWSSSNVDVVKVDDKGTITGVKTGEATITAKSSNGMSVTCKVNVKSKTIKVTGIQMNKKKVSISVNKKAQLSATVSPSNATNQNVKWSSSNTNIATVDSKGVVTAKAKGTATITVETIDGGFKDTSTITVNVPVTGITLNKTSDTISINNKTTLVATITPNNANNTNVSWISSNTNIATVDTKGVVTGKGQGTATITVTTKDGGFKATAKIKVENIKITAISLKETSTMIVKGKSYTISSSITPSNATIKALDYESTDTKIATVSDKGVVTGKGLGTVTIKVKAKDGSGKVAKLKIVVVGSQRLIDLKNGSYTYTVPSRYKNMDVRLTSNSSSKHMQNFAIKNIDTADEVGFFSTVQKGCSNSNDVKELNRTIVLRVPKKDYSNPSSSSRKVMYMEASGHGQSFDMELNSEVMWTTYNATTSHFSYNKYWGLASGIQRTKFKTIASGGKFEPLMHTKLTTSSGSAYNNLEASIDYTNNLIAFRSGTKIFIYDLSKAKKKDFSNTVYSFKITDDLGTYSNGGSIYRQGIALSGGYLYIYRGAPGKNMYIEAYNLLGKYLYAVNITSKYGISSSNNREAEGMKIYNNKIYIGSTHTINNKSGSYFDIGYFKAK